VERSTYLLGRQAQRQLEALELATEQLRKLSSIDPLTGIANRRRFETELTAPRNAALATQHPMSLLIVDVDHFKLYNDGYGHPAGDVCLKRIAIILDDLATRAGGLAARLGGEEFAILLDASEADYAWRLGEQICTTIYAHALPHRYSLTADRVTVSVGVSTQVPTASAWRQALLHAADQALYRAKESGRNRVMGEASDARQLSCVASRLL